jgi:hypothetical protein
MSKVIGNATVTPMAVTDWEQDDEKKADYIKNKPKGLVNKEYVSNKFAGALKGTATGETVTMTDVSPVEHEMSIKATSNNIPLYPYDTDAELIKSIAGFDCTITDDGVFKIKGVSNGVGGEVLIKTLTLPAGWYKFWAEGYDVNLGVMFVQGAKRPDGSNIICIFTGDDTISAVDFYSEDDVISIWLSLNLLEAGTSYSWSIKPYLSKGSEIAPEVSSAKVYQVDMEKNLFNYKDWIDYAKGYYSTGTYAPQESVVHLGEECFSYVCGRPMDKPTRFFNGIKFKENTQYTFTFEGAYTYTSDIYANFLNIVYTDGTINIIYGDISQNKFVKKTVTSEAGKTIASLSIINYSQDLRLYIKKNMQIVEGTSAIPPTECSVSADGTVEAVITQTPTTLLYTDTAGVSLSVGYNRDINKVCADQQARIERLETMLLNSITN